MTRAGLLGLVVLCFLVGFFVAIEAHQIDPPASWLNARTLAIGRFGGTDSEIMECDFAIGGGAMLMLHPSGEPCQIARELIGRSGRIVFVPDP